MCVKMSEYINFMSGSGDGVCLCACFIVVFIAICITIYRQIYYTRSLYDNKIEFSWSI